jgi:hypothetical protein
VSYFLADSGTKTSDGSPLFNLYRRVQLLAEEPGAILLAPDPNFSTVAIPNPQNPAQTVYAVNTMATLKVLTNRPAPFTPLTGADAGTDIILSNVVSFEIKANWDSTQGFRKLPPTLAGPTGGNGDVPNLDYPYDDLPVIITAPPQPMALPAVNTSSQYEMLPRIFDTAGTQSAEPLLGIGLRYHSKVRILGLQIKLRIWDSKNSQTRQVTVIQDM